ncbi:MAG: host-nuclease inhibitor Gam family protein [Magnetococcus sp. YQC-5]
MTSRVKPQPVYMIADMQQANAVLGEMAMLQRAITTIEADMNSVIDTAKRNADAFAAPRRKRLKDLETALSVFAEFNKETLFNVQRTAELAFGVFGFRRSTELKPKSKITWAMVLGKIKELGFAAIRVKDEVDRDAMREWPEERLSLVGVQRIQKDVFWYEIKQEELGVGG